MKILRQPRIYPTRPRVKSRPQRESGTQKELRPQAQNKIPNHLRRARRAHRYRQQPVLQGRAAVQGATGVARAR